MGRLKKPQQRGKEKKVLYRRLRERMQAYDVTTDELAERCLISKATLSHKMTGKTPWRSDEMWQVMHYLKIPDEEFHLYFPAHGEDAEDKRQTAADAYLRDTNKSAVSDSSLHALKALVDSMYNEAI